jgi:hypothetical protein
LIAEHDLETKTHVHTRGGTLLKHIFDSKDEKITEKAFVQSVVISVVGILLCIVALCSATFCWFTGETESNRNTLVSGSFDLSVAVAESNAETESDAEIESESMIAVVPHTQKEGVWTCSITKPGTYTVTLTLKDGSSVKGHCIVTVGEDTPKHTDAIIGEHTANDADAPLSNPFTFTFTVTEASDEKPVTVTFEPRWGVAVTFDIPNGGTYPMQDVPAQGDSDPSGADA